MTWSDTVPGYSADRPDEAGRLVALHGDALLTVAVASIEHGLAKGAALIPDLDRFDPALRDRRASFVTLRIAGKLRGCIGKSQACCPLVTDVAENAFAAAFEDDRFRALPGPEIDDLDVEVSVLSDPAPLRFEGEPDLLRKLKPGTDGVILEHGSHRGLFLPDVWKTLPEPGEFLAQLKIKAGLPADFWSNDITASHFTTASTSLSRRSGRR